MKIMWVNEGIEATVEFARGLAFPRLHAIRFRDEVVTFAGAMHVEPTSTALLYRADSGRSEYTVCFEPARQCWVLEAIRDVPSFL